MSMVKSLLEIQANSFNPSFKVVFDELKDELTCVKKDISDLQQSLSFSQGQLDTSMKHIEQVEMQVNVNNKFLKDTSDSLDAMDTELEYLENQSRRNNIRIVGVPEDSTCEKSWDDTKNLVTQLVKDNLNIHEEVEIERCHRVTHSYRGSKTTKKGTEHPRTIVAKFASWKTRVARWSGNEQLKKVAKLVKNRPN